MSASGPGSMLPGGSAEERGYRRFLEVFLGEFRGPFLSPEPPPPLPQQEQQPPQPQLQPPPSDGEREGEGEGDAAEEEEEEEEGSAGGGGGGDSQEPSEDQREEDADAAAATPEDPGADAAPGEPEPPEEEEEEEAGEGPPSPPPPARAPTPPLPALPRPLSEPITEEEVEGECLDLCLHQLYKYNCPSLLAAALARATADEVLQSDLSAHYLPKHADSPDGIIQVETVKLARTVFSKLHETCSSWARDFPLQQKPHRFYETSIHAIKNMRRKMEDKHVCIPDFNTLFNLEDQEEQAYFAVFDGHGGVDAAIYASIHLHVNLVHQETFQQDPAEALCRAFHVTDERFVQKAARESLRCGTTGVVTFIRGNVLHVAWLGDSQVMLVRRGQAVELMKPHKPDREDEKKRIEALGGCVIWFGAWRVNGSLSVSRAIGDAEHKPYICGDADSASMVLDGSEDYLILACDGFYDTVSPEEAVKVVADHLQENQGDSSMVAHKLVASARDAGSSDNITVIVVFLRDMSAAVSASQETEWTENSFQDGQEDSGDDPENQGKRPWPQHQVSAPADLGYDGREDSFTDRTTLSAGPTRATFVEEPGYLDLRKADACKLPSAKRLSPEPGLTAAAVPKRATLESGFPAESQPAAAAAAATTFPPCGQSSGPGPLTSLSLGVAPGLSLEYSRASPPPASTRLEGERFKAWGRRASIFSHFHFCDPKRWQRLARLKPKLHRLLLLEPRPLSRPEGLPGSVNGRRSSRGPRGGLWQGLSSSCQSRGGGSILLLLRQSRCLAEPGLL